MTNRANAIRTNTGKIQKNLVALMSDFYDVKLKRSINKQSSSEMCDVNFRNHLR